MKSFYENSDGTDEHSNSRTASLKQKNLIYVTH